MLTNIKVSELKPIAQVIEDIKTSNAEDIQNSLKYHAEELVKHIEKAELLRQAIGLLDACEVELRSTWTTRTFVEFDLGFFKGKGGSATLKSILIAIRRALGCSLVLHRKEVCDVDGKKDNGISVTLKASAFPVTIAYQKLPPRHLKGQKPRCRIVTRKVKTLVCERPV